MKIRFMNVALTNKSKTRILRKIVKWKNPLMCCMAFIVALGLLYGAYSACRLGYYCLKYSYHAYILDDLYSSYNSSTKIGPAMKFYESGPFGYIENTHTRKRILKNVNWVSGVWHNDSLVCFASHDKRGYLNRYTGDIPIPATRYYKAWLFSEGLACVMESDGTLKFVNPKGEVIINKQFKYSYLPDDMAYVFHNGYCPMNNGHGEFGLIDKEGEWAVTPKYDGIFHTDEDWWIVYDNKKKGVLNDSLRLVLSPEYREVKITPDGLDVLTARNERQLLDFDGNIKKKFMFTDLLDLSYKIQKTDDPDDYEVIPSKYKAYQTTYSFSNMNTRMGLLGPDGLPVTAADYVYIEALGPDRFRCYYNDCPGGDVNEGLSVLINSKGEVVEPK